jgi:ABC-type nitrate/sulfonate/bicarbonate transport system substrate-binding protein
MSLAKLRVLYGHLEGTGGRFARDPSGYLSIEAGIFRKHGLEVSWQHVQGTEERYRRLENRSADISLVVGRASLQHFLILKTTRIIGCAMNSCPYYMIVAPPIEDIRELKGRIVVCREGPSRNVPLGETFQAFGGLEVGVDLRLQLPDSDQEACKLLMDGEVQAALLPRPYAFIAEEQGFKRIANWPDVVDDPLPITIETTQSLLREREKDLSTFLTAHREGILYMKTHQTETVRMLEEQFGHSSWFAAKTFDEYLVFMNERLMVDFEHLEKLVAQVAPAIPGGARQVASDWIRPGALSRQF